MNNFFNDPILFPNWFRLCAVGLCLTYCLYYIVRLIIAIIRGDFK